MSEGLRHEAPAPKAQRRSVLIIAPHSSYRTAPFLGAAQKLDVNVMVASQGKHSVVSAYAGGLHIDLQDNNSALHAILEEAKKQPFAAVIGTDDPTTELAALVKWLREAGFGGSQTGAAADGRGAETRH